MSSRERKNEHNHQEQQLEPKNLVGEKKGGTAGVEEENGETNFQQQQQHEQHENATTNNNEDHDEDAVQQQQQQQQQQSIIKRLDHDTIRRITAEQAISDLSSIVKELVDNALDADSTTIKSKFV